MLALHEESTSRTLDSVIQHRLDDFYEDHHKTLSDLQPTCKQSIKFEDSVLEIGLVAILKPSTWEIGQEAQEFGVILGYTLKPAWAI